MSVATAATVEDTWFDTVKKELEVCIEGFVAVASTYYKGEKIPLNQFSEVNLLSSKEAIKIQIHWTRWKLVCSDSVMLQTALLISLWWSKPLERFYMSLFLGKMCCFPVLDCSYFSKNVIFSEKKLFLLIDCGDSQCQYLVKWVGDQRCWCVTGVPYSIYWHTSAFDPPTYYGTS